MFTLGRKIDFSYQTNKIIVILSILIALIGWLVTGRISAGLYIGAGVFLTWALSREVDPKHEHSAFLAAGFSLLNLLYYENIQLLVIFWIILLMRLVNGITGKEPTAFDIFSVLGLTVYLSFNMESSIYLIGFILAMALLIRVKENSRMALIAGGISLLFFIVESFFMKYLSIRAIDYSNPINIFASLAFLISFIAWNFLSKGKIEDDIGNIMKRSRVLAGQIIYSIAIILLFFFGTIGLNNLIIYLSVIVGVSIYFIGYKILARPKAKL